ncbi:MAG: sodium:proton antiporter [Rikenellaceae bacterium]|nr:sodium:proton antiporter [Rikenellaceae bacterium]
MKKVISFSLMLMLGLVLSQVLPTHLGESYAELKHLVELMLGICLAFIMINVGREFEIDKSNVKIYVKDYLVAMLAAALPWIFIAVYYIFALMPVEWWSSGDVWKETLLLSRFAAPTSAGILFSMLAAMNLQKSWIYQKAQTLAIFDDLDTIILMVPLQVAMIGSMNWQMVAMLTVIFGLFFVGWRYMSRFKMRQTWYAIFTYAVLVYGSTLLIYTVTNHFFGEKGAIHIEVLLPAFIFGMVIKNRHVGGKREERIATIVSLVFMLLVGMSMPLIDMSGAVPEGDNNSIIATVPMMSGWEIALHVLMVTLLSNLGKLAPMLFYRDRSLTERFALSVGMFTRGEVGAGVIFIALGYNIGGPVLLISVLALVLNLILTMGFVYVVKRLALKAEAQNR